MRVPRLTTLVRVAATVILFAVFRASSASGQQGVLSAGDFDSCKQDLQLRIDKNHLKLTGSVECRRGDTEVFADEIEYWLDTHRAILTGNVTIRDKSAQISADRAEFNTETRLGTFYNASGFAVVADEAKLSPMGGQEPDVYFYGDIIEKIGEDKYRITRGGFTTCLQPTPRWQITSGSITLRVDHYAFLTNALIRAKGVPVFYLPAFYYPIQKDDRATGFLMPTYGTSTYRGVTLSDAFFWAINRSQDATFSYDWFSKRGQGMGAEYRYAAAPGSSGFVSFYSLAEKATTTQNADGSQTVTPATRSYQMRANVNQALSRRWTARGRVDYFTNINTQQAYNTNIFDASRSTRTYGGSISGAVAGLSVNGDYNRTEYFSGTTDTTVTGGTPRILVSKNEQPLFGSPVYFSVNGEFANLVRETRSAGTVSDRGVTRFDVMPTIRIPFTKLQFLTVNTSVAWRGTYWTRSQLPDTTVVENDISRSYFDFQARITGPVIGRVWNTPKSGYAEKWKHTVEPFLNVQRVTGVDNFDRIIQLDGTDYILGGTTRFDYGVSSRALAKRKAGGGGSSAREILGFTISQTYYSDDRASQYDWNYTTSFTGKPPTHLSPIRMSLRATPGDQVQGAFRMEYDTSEGVIQSMVADGQLGIREWLHVSAGFSQRRLASTIDVAPRLDNYILAAATMRTEGNRLGGTYTFNYDLGRSTLLTSRIIGYYNVQCCGFAVEYQIYNFPQGNPAFPVAKDRRFNFSFTLSGLGTFSNFFGAMGGLGSQ